MINLKLYITLQRGKRQNVVNDGDLDTNSKKIQKIKKENEEKGKKLPQICIIRTFQNIEQRWAN